jgi:hypothetical protein
MADTTTTLARHPKFETVESSFNWKPLPILLAMHILHAIGARPAGAQQYKDQTPMPSGVATPDR